MSSSAILPRSFYERDTLCVVKELLGKVLKFADYHGVINEVEAYVGLDDPACHTKNRLDILPALKDEDVNFPWQQ